MAARRTESKSKIKIESKKNRENSSQKNDSSALKNEDSDSVKSEILLTVAALLSVLFILSYFNICGKFGEMLSGIMFGLMGIFTYVFPIVFFFLSAFCISNKGNRIAQQKIISAIIFIFLLTALIQIIYGIDENRSFFDYYTYCAETKTGGGIFGAVLCVPLMYFFGQLATVIIISALMIICIMILTGKALFTYLRKKSEISIKKGKERYHQREEIFESIEEEEIKETLEYRKKFPFVTIEPENGEKEKKASSNQNENKRPPEAPISFLDALKDKGRKSENKHIFSTDEIELMNMAEPLETSTVEMSEIHPEKSKYTIVGNITEEDHSSDNTGYEEELKRKFGVKEENKEVVPTEKKKSNTELNEVEKNTVETTTVEKKNPIAKEKISHEEEQAQINAMTNAITEPVKKYIFPPISLLSRPVNSNSSISRKEIDRNADTLQRTLSSFGVHVKLVNVSCGPAVTRYELQPEQGVKVSSVTKLENDIKLNLAASDIRIEAPIPGKAAIGIEVPNKENSSVILRDLIESDEYKKQKSGLAFAVGKDISGQNIISDIAKMPHLLIAGATGSGKSVCINTLIVSLLYKSSPADVRLIMVDPKVVELSVYNGIPHLLIPVVTDPKKASAALNWAVMEMTNRYGKFAEMQVRDLKSYNEKLEEEPYKSDPNFQKMPQIVIIVDELADLMMVAQNDVEDAICRLAQMARAAGMHLVIATQRPSVNVITGVIKANVPSRIAFSVSSNIDSRTIIDSGGAEKLLGKGDMLFYPSGYPKPIRVQGAFISDKEVSSIVEYIKEKNNEPQYNEEMASHISMMQSSNSAVHSDQSNSSVNGLDEYFTEAGKFIIEKDKASIGMLQRVYRIGFNRAARIMEQLADAGVVSEEEGTKPRHVLMSREQFDQYVEENV